MSILNQLASTAMSVQLSGTCTKTLTRKIGGASQVLATEYHGDEKAFSGRINMLPEPWHTKSGMKSLKAAYNAVRTAFYKHTMPYGMDAAGGAGADAKAKGERLVLVKHIADGSFVASMDALLADLEVARNACAGVWDLIITDIEASHVLGVHFDRDFFPTAQDIKKSWYYAPINPTPLPNTTALDGAYMPRDVLESIEERMEEQALGRLRFGQQQLALEAAGYIQTLVQNTARISAWADDPNRGKRPPVGSNVVSNIKEAIGKLRSFAMPESSMGLALIDLVDQVEGDLNLDSFTPEDLKNSVVYSELVHSRATKAEQTLTNGIDNLFAGFGD